MSDLIWGSRTPGSNVMPTKNPIMAIIGKVSIGDTVRLPEELGEGTVKIQAIVEALCPGCKKTHSCYVLPDSLVVFECTINHGFYWARLREESKP